MKRRTALMAAAAFPGVWPRLGAAQTSADDMALVQLLRKGACVFMIRHAQTVAGIGDPPELTLGQCGTQRNLSSEGRAQAQKLGEWFAQHGLQPRQVHSSQWCRCQDTARLAFGRYTDLPALNSTFGTGERQPAQTARLRQLLREVPTGQFDVWVTHQVNMTDLAGTWPAMGEAFVIDGQARLRAKRPF